MAELANANFATATELANYLVKGASDQFSGVPRDCRMARRGTRENRKKTFADWELTQELLREKKS